MLQQKAWGNIFFNYNNDNNGFKKLVWDICKTKKSHWGQGVYSLYESIACEQANARRASPRLANLESWILLRVYMRLTTWANNIYFPTESDICLYNIFIL